VETDRADDPDAAEVVKKIIKPRRRQDTEEDTEKKFKLILSPWLPPRLGVSVVHFLPPDLFAFRIDGSQLRGILPFVNSRNFLIGPKVVAPLRSESFCAARSGPFLFDELPQ
jgi:hypothetical protein